MKKFDFKQLSVFQQKRQTSSFILNLCSKPLSIINQFQIFSSKSEQKVFVITPNDLNSILFERKECKLVDLMCDAEAQLQHFKYHEAEVIYTLLKETIFPNHLSTYRTYYAKILTGLGYLTFYQRRYDEALTHFNDALSHWTLVNNHAQVVYCLQMIGVVYRYRNKKGDNLKSLYVLDKGELASKVSTNVSKSLRKAMLGNCLRDKAEILLKSGYPEEAYKTASKSLRELQNCSESIYSYTKFIESRALFELSKHDRDLQQMLKVLNKIESHPIFKLRCHTFLMKAFSRVLKDRTEALKHFRKAMEAAGEFGHLAEAMALHDLARKHGLNDFANLKTKRPLNRIDFKKSYDYFALL